ncbi:MAG: bifunctional precorrin-2 dehydrogenase/sirohydrochlorin ferrochelatase [Deltaproteobacteria bacterium]|nr:bifunctional precorrin-2 dehydrogenase/sirohydrochlorin ferrochelatase [Deltaproteobacteria bacterium]
MKYYPVNLDIRNQPCLVVGGGAVGTRKVRTLLDCGAMVTVVSPLASNSLSVLARENRISLKQRPYRASDLEGIFLVIGATDNKDLNRVIHDDARKLGTLCNIADQPDLCNFILPAIIERGDLIIAVSTSGKSPAFARHLRKELEVRFGPEYADFLKLMGIVRKILLEQTHDPETHQRVFESLIEQGLLECIREGDKARIDAMLISVLGPGHGYDRVCERGDDI